MAWGLDADATGVAVAGGHDLHGGPPRVRSLVIGLVGVLAATAAGTLGEADAAFTAVSGDGGLWGSAFATTVTTKLGNGDLLLPIIIGLGLGAIGVFGALRGPKV